MNESIFYEYVKNNLDKVVAKVVSRLNDKEQSALTYLYKSMLKYTYCVSGIWTSLNENIHRVSADFVAMDSTLPLKTRDAISKASGEIVKSGMEMRMTEKQMSDLEDMMRAKIDKKEVLEHIFNDTKRCIEGMFELMERCFLEGLSTGVCALDDEKNVGIGVRMDYGYLDSHRFTPKVKWSDHTNSRPLDDIRKILKAGKDEGRSATVLMMDEVAFDNFIKSEQVRQYYGWSMEFFGQNVNIPTPNLEQINSALKKDSQYKITIEIVDRRIFVERNGVRKAYSPWAEGVVVFLETKNVGILAWTKCVEASRPVSGVTYSTAEQAILVSKFRDVATTLQEVTRVQARMVPVITNVEGIWTLDTKGGDTDNEEGDGKVDILGGSYTKAKVVEALGKMSIEVADTITEADLVGVVNDLSRKKKDELKTLISE